MLKEIGGVEEGGMEIGCDGLSALRRSFQVGPEEISAKHAHFDILSGIHGMVRVSNIRWTVRYVKGHQDDVLEKDLDSWDLLNIECDLRAKGFLVEIIKGYKQPKHRIERSVGNQSIWNGSGH